MWPRRSGRPTAGRLRWGSAGPTDGLSSSTTSVASTAEAMACAVATCAERLGGVGAVSVCGPFCPGEKSSAPGRRRAVHVERVRRHVRSDIVEDVGVTGDRDGADDDRDHDAEADGRERRARAGPVTRHVAQWQADGDGRSASDPGQQGEEERRDEDDPDDQRDEPRDQPDHAAAVPRRRPRRRTGGTR